MYTTNPYVSLGLMTAGAITTYFGVSNFCKARNDRNALLTTAVGVALFASGAYGIRGCFHAFLESRELERLEREAELLKRASEGLKTSVEASEILLQIPMNTLKLHISTIAETKTTFTQANSAKSSSEIYDIFSLANFSELSNKGLFFQNTPDVDFNFKKELSEQCSSMLNNLGLRRLGHLVNDLQGHVDFVASLFKDDVDFQCRLHSSSYPNFCEQLKNQTSLLQGQVSSLVNRTKDLIDEINSGLAELKEVCQSIN